MEIENILDLLFDYFNVKTMQELSIKMNVSQPTISKWKSRNSVSAIKKKCRELGIYNDIFGDIQKIGSISGGQVAQNVSGNQLYKSDNNENDIDTEILKVLKSAIPIIENDDDKKEALIKHIKEWIFENL